MNDAARLDYFRSEFEGKIAQLRKESVEKEASLWAEIKRLSDTVEKQGRELHEIKVSI